MIADKENLYCAYIPGLRSSHSSHFFKHLVNEIGGVNVH